MSCGQALFVMTWEDQRARNHNDVRRAVCQVRPVKLMFRSAKTENVHLRACTCVARGQNNCERAEEDYFPSFCPSKETHDAGIAPLQRVVVHHIGFADDMTYPKKCFNTANARRRVSNTVVAPLADMASSTGIGTRIAWATSGLQIHFGEL